MELNGYVAYIATLIVTAATLTTLLGVTAPEVLVTILFSILAYYFGNQRGLKKRNGKGGS